MMARSRGSTQRPNTLMQLSRSSVCQHHLATHGRTIHVARSYAYPDFRGWPLSRPSRGQEAFLNIVLHQVPEMRLIHRPTGCQLPGYWRDGLARAGRVRRTTFLRWEAISGFPKLACDQAMQRVLRIKQRNARILGSSDPSCTGRTASIQSERPGFGSQRAHHGPETRHSSSPPAGCPVQLRILSSI
jgi:hypothetical protein